jgi:glycogen debranching enzyme
VGSWRVWHRFGTGDEGFTNDPPGVTVVTRDAAWFLFGSDYFAPELSRALLKTLVRHAVYPEGKIAEFVRLLPNNVTRDDYGLNLNDATPLFVLAAAHHWRKTGDRALLELCYPTVKGATDWILGQRNAEGLVWCDGKGTNVWGIAGWRNIVPGHRIAGAVTELNALCAAALRAAVNLAAAMQDSESATRFYRESERLQDAMSQLVNPKTGLFYLSRDERGAHDCLAIDLAFPALFQVGPLEARTRTLLRLAEPDFLCSRGVRSVPTGAPDYHPRFGWGLMGGSWPNATAWVAAALFPHQPVLAWELTERIARSLFPETTRQEGVSVPGEFPEWFDGDTGESCGMSLSPWMPATFVWLIEEGLRSGTVLC